MTTTTTDAVGALARRPMRADARRNYTKLIDAAREVFTDSGVDASLEEIARRAEVGIGTLYRHFPTRQDLIEATYLEEVETLCASVDELTELPPWDALTAWLDRLTRYILTKRAFANELMATLGAESAVLRGCHTAIWDAGTPLLLRAQQAGVVRDDVELDDVVRLVSGVTMARNSSAAQIDRALRIALDGLRYRGSD